MEFQFITPAEPIACPRLWKDFSAPAFQAARLEITGLGLYRAYLNGQRVGKDYLTPGMNDYDAYLRYQTYDVSALLRAENCLEVYLGNGWYKGRFGYGEHSRNRWGDAYHLAARLILTTQQGEETVLATDETWQAAPSCILDDSIYDGETRDDTRRVDRIVPCKKETLSYRLEPQFSPAIRPRAEFKGRLIVTPKGEQVLDFGQNMAGVIRFVNRLPAGKTLRIQTGEVMQQGCFYRDNLRSAKSEFVYTSDGVEKVVEPLFTFFGFRYAKIEGLNAVDPADFTAVALCSDLKETIACETGYPLLNQLISNTRWGQRSNFLDVPTDCPQRDERLGWTGDTQVFCNTACYQMDCKAFYRKFMRDMRADQTMYYHGNLPKFSPSLRGIDAVGGGAVWADAATIVPWTVYQHYGDLPLLRESYPMMRDYAEWLITEDEKAGGTHLVFPYHTYGDWLAQDGMSPQSVWGGTRKEFIQGVYYYYSMHLTALAARELDEEADAKKYAGLAEEVRNALLDEYVTAGGNLSEDTQTAYVLALKYGVYRNKEKLIARFRERVRKDFYKLTSGFTGAPLLLPVLMDNGMADIAYRMLLSEEFPGWLYAVKLGATTIWERWNSLNPDGSISGTGMNSLNHYAYGSVCEAIYTRIAGLQCAAPGFKKAIVAPHPDGRLGRIHLRHESAAGVWEAGWEIQPDGRIVLNITVPQDASAKVVLPDHPENLTLEAGPGAHSYVWTPNRDYRHPYGQEDALVEDARKNPQAAAILQAYLPPQWQGWALSAQEGEIMPLGQVKHHIGPEKWTEMMEKLRQVEA